MFRDANKYESTSFKNKTKCQNKNDLKSKETLLSQEWFCNQNIQKCPTYAPAL